jgi:hypothetical protein
MNNQLPIGSIADPFTGSSWQSLFIGLQKAHNTGNLYQSYPAAQLPKGIQEGQTAFATNGRKVGETAGNGTGVPVYYSNGQWRVYSTDAQVTT